MSYLSSQNVQCETLQKSLETEFQSCPTPLEAMPALEAILATQNAVGIAQSVSDGMGKVKTVKVTYDQRALESAVTETTGARSCTSTNETYNNYTTYTIDPSTKLEYGEKIDIADLATVCEDPAMFYAKKINKIIDVLERKQATKTATELVALYGKWGSNVSGVTSDELVVSTLVSTATKVLDYSAMSSIDIALMQTGYCAPPIIVGGTSLYAYGKQISAGCCSTTGVNIMDMANQFGKAFLYDKRVATALGSDAKSLVMQAGSVALITYNEYNENELPNITSNYSKIKVFSPRTGLPIDIVIKDDCGTISIIGYLTAKVVGLPTDMFAVGDEYRGVTFVNKIKVTNPA